MVHALSGGLALYISSKSTPPWRARGEFTGLKLGFRFGCVLFLVVVFGFSVLLFVFVFGF